ncbi:MAG: cobalamin-dependent protein [Methanomassiliicoccales archaeon]|nr:MAG: cobalamin-dependent protein [Methanomassiliicoccales archaeon]
MSGQIGGLNGLIYIIHLESSLDTFTLISNKIMGLRNMITNDCDILLVGYEEWENLGLRSIASFLAEHDIKVEIEPIKTSQKDNILEGIRAKNPKIVGFSLIFQRMLFEFADLIDFLRSNRITVHFTMGGHFPTIEYKATLESIPGLDSVVRGEGEETLLELYNNLDRPNSWAHIKGIAYRDNGKIKATPARPLLQNLDELPFPIRSDFTMTQRGLGMSSILGSRGCYYNCSFCSIRQFYREMRGPKRRSRSPKNIVQEMEQLFYDLNVRIFIFEDDDLGMRSRSQQRWVEDFVEELKKKEFSNKIMWRVSCRVDEIKAELLRKMMEVGLISVYTGIESGNAEGLKTYNKLYTLNDIYKTLEILKNLNLPFEFGFMILNPDSTFARMNEDIVFLKEIGKSGQAVVHFTKMVPYTGTPIADRLKKEGKLTGTIASPDYNYEDPRLESLQLFFTQAFHFRNFDNNGLVERLRHAKFDAIIQEKFFSDEYDSKSYSDRVRDLIRQSNEAALEKMSIAVKFMEKRSEEEILENWHFLDHLAREEKEIEWYITSTLNKVMTHYGFGQ